MFHTFQPQDLVGEFYLCVSRIIKHKRIDLLIDSFNSLNRELYIIGEGEEQKEIRA